MGFAVLSYLKMEHRLPGTPARTHLSHHLPLFDHVADLYHYARVIRVNRLETVHMINYDCLAKTFQAGVAIDYLASAGCGYINTFSCPYVYPLIHELINF